MPKQSVVRTLKESIKTRRHKGVIGLLSQMREDWAFNGESYFTPGFQALATHRFGVWQKGLPWAVRPPLAFIYQVLFVFVRNFYGIELPSETVVGRRVKLAHQSGIVIHPNAKIGDECRIRQNVTIGAATRFEQAPILGCRVLVGAGAVIVGNVVVGDDAHIGPNAVVTSNVPPGATVFAPAPRIIQMPKRPEPEQIASAAEGQVKSHDAPGSLSATHLDAEPVDVTRQSNMPQLPDETELSS